MELNRKRKAKMRLFIVRHGQSQSNADWEIIQKPVDNNSSLTTLGENQAEKLAEWMKTAITQVDLIYSSSLTRALQTAKSIAEAYDLTIYQDHRLREGGHSYSDGSPIPDDLLPMNKRLDWHSKPFEPLDPSVEGCESYADVKERVAGFLDEIIASHLGKTIVAVTHAWTSNAFYDVILNSCALRQCHIHFGNTAISYFRYNPEWELGPWYAYFLAQTPHVEFIPEGLE
jgi:probable phosphoglycerate mutase